MTDFYILKSEAPLDKGHSEGNETDRGDRKSKLLLHGLTFLQMRYIALGL